MLRVRELRTYFTTERGVLRAVEGVSFDLLAGETLAWWGKAAPGKV